MLRNIATTDLFTFVRTPTIICHEAYPLSLSLHLSGMICSDQTSVSGTPPSSRCGHSAVALGESLVVFGGMNGQDGVTFNDIFELRTGKLALVPPFN